MKILKIFGLVVGIHVFALIVIFASPGCSSTRKPPPAPIDTVPKSEPPPAVTVPNTPVISATGVYTSPVTPAPVTPAPIAPAPVAFDPNAAATSSSAAATGPATVRFTPTRPGTPAAGTLVAEPVADVTPATTYVVKAGDSLWSIAKKHKLTVADLTNANGLAANANLQPGQKLVIPGKSTPASATKGAPAAKSAAAPRPGGEVVKHVVKTGETLGTIARNYGVRQADIAATNSISDPARIQAGMELIIPGWQPASGKAAKGAGKGAAKAVDPKAEPKVEAPAAPPPSPPAVPIIRIDDAPVTPAPKR
jgi:LysM repeat protein